MHTLGMVLVLIGVILVALDWLFGPPAATGHQRIRTGLLHLGIVLVGLGVLFLFDWAFSVTKLAPAS
jgi:hypothetical protein